MGPTATPTVQRVEVGVEVEVGASVRARSPSLVVATEGEIRLGDARHVIRAGDVIACPPGGPETAHQIVNRASERR